VAVCTVVWAVVVVVWAVAWAVVWAVALGKEWVEPSLVSLAELWRAVLWRIPCP